MCRVVLADEARRSEPTPPLASKERVEESPLRGRSLGAAPLTNDGFLGCDTLGCCTCDRLFRLCEPGFRCELLSYRAGGLVLGVPSSEGRNLRLSTGLLRRLLLCRRKTPGPPRGDLALLSLGSGEGEGRSHGLCRSPGLLLVS